MIRQKGDYVLAVSFIGFTKREMPIKVSDGENKIQMDNIILEEEASMLGEVTVTGTPPVVSRKDNKTIINLSQTVSAGQSALDMLKHISGITTVGDGALSLNGKKNVSVLIDGVQVWLTPAQLTQMLEGLPASNMEKVEVYSSSPANFDAGGTGGVINIVTKRQKTEAMPQTLLGEVDLASIINYSMVM